MTGDRGLTLQELAPYGVIASITPSTNPTSTVICNAIGMLAAGNSVVFNVHPMAAAVCNHTVKMLNEAIIAAGGPPNLITSVEQADHRERSNPDDPPGSAAVGRYGRTGRGQGGDGQWQTGDLRRAGQPTRRRRRDSRHSARPAVMSLRALRSITT